jgi:type III restriction enzyme
MAKNDDPSDGLKFNRRNFLRTTGVVGLAETLEHWALCIPYGQGLAKPLYPDMVAFRREGGKVEIDILDPHDDARADAAEKAVGLANFARRHGAAFGRIETVRIVNGQIQRLRLHQESVRDKVLKVTDLKHLAESYSQHG